MTAMLNLQSAKKKYKLMNIHAKLGSNGPCSFEEEN